MPGHTEEERKKKKKPQKLPEEEPEKLKTFTDVETRKKSGIITKDDRVFFGSAAREFEETERRKGRFPGTEPLGQQDKLLQREDQIRKGLGTESLKSELEQKIAQSPSLKPKDISQGVAEAGLAPAVGIGNLITSGLEGVTGKTFGRQTAEELAQTGFGKALGIATAAAGTALVGAAGTAAIPFLTQQAARSTVLKSTASLISKNKIATGLILGATIGGKPLDVNRGEIETSRKVVSRMVEDGEKIEASVRNGLDVEIAISQIRDMVESVSESESRIKEASILNAKYRFDDEHLADEAQMVTARTALLRRIEAIENIAISGTAVLNPEALMLDVSRF